MEINVLLFLIFIVLLLNFLLNLRKNFPELLDFKRLYITSYICILNVIIALFFLVYSRRSHYVKEEIYLMIVYAIVYFILNNKFKILNYTINYIFGVPYILLIDYTENLFKKGEIFLFLVFLSLVYTVYEIIKYKEYRKQLIISIIIFFLTFGVIYFLETH